MVYRLRRQPFCFSAGGAHAQQRHKGRLGVRGVLASRLPELIGGGRRLEHIVGDLKSEANCFSVRAKPSSVFWRAICTESPMTQEAAINAPVLRRCPSSSAAPGSASASASRSSAWPPIIPPAP